MFILLDQDQTLSKSLDLSTKVENYTTKKPLQLSIKDNNTKYIICVDDDAIPTTSELSSSSTKTSSNNTTYLTYTIDVSNPSDISDSTPTISMDTTEKIITTHEASFDKDNINACILSSCDMSSIFTDGGSTILSFYPKMQQIVDKITSQSNDDTNKDTDTSDTDTSDTDASNTNTKDTKDSTTGSDSTTDADSDSSPKPIHFHIFLHTPTPNDVNSFSQDYTIDEIRQDPKLQSTITTYNISEDMISTILDLYKEGDDASMDCFCKDNCIQIHKKLRQESISEHDKHCNTKDGEQCHAFRDFFESLEEFAAKEPKKVKLDDNDSTKIYQKLESTLLSWRYQDTSLVYSIHCLSRKPEDWTFEMITKSLESL